MIVLRFKGGRRRRSCCAHHDEGHLCLNRPVPCCDRCPYLATHRASNPPVAPSPADSSTEEDD